jgi:hypothetical protein
MNAQDEQAVCDAATTGDIEGAIELVFDATTGTVSRDEAVDAVNDIVKRLYHGNPDDNQWSKA